MNDGDFAHFRLALERSGNLGISVAMFTTNGKTSADGSRWDDGRPIRLHRMPFELGNSSPTAKPTSFRVPAIGSPPDWLKTRCTVSATTSSAQCAF